MQKQPIELLCIIYRGLVNLSSFFCLAYKNAKADAFLRIQLFM